MMGILERGFKHSEFEKRTFTIQKMMHKQKLDAVFLTTEPNVRYFSGFFTQFWESPTRPWFLIIPAAGKPIAVIPEIGAAGMADTWIDDIHTWASPNPEDDGISLVTNILNQLPARHGLIGATLGIESCIRMPFNNFMKISDGLKGKTFVDIASQIHYIRSVKSKSEIEKIRRACEITHHGFANIPNHAEVGLTEHEICKQMRMDMIREGADSVKYLIAGSGLDGY
ncbi:aminopeptidase P family N-terminal domain-containing protein, partial [bacterium]|nr:aminopeptidase P family N-terminal domain-containing protein [bacterium]